LFAYTDPVGTGLLQSLNALQEYRQIIHEEYRRFARLPNSTFTLLEAFQELSPGIDPAVTTVTWIAFPRTAVGTFEEIDQNRFQFQDEYVEWFVERLPDGSVAKVTFSTEFPEYYEALARVGTDELIRGIQEAIPLANPTVAELFGPNFNPQFATPDGRASQLVFHAARNPWNNGDKGILFLTQPFNTLGALFNLVGRCSINRPDLATNAVCANVGGACGPDRNSDPRVCESSQTLARTGNGLSLADPVGIRITSLEGIWKINGEQVDINDTLQNQAAWTTSRSGRRAILDVTKGVTIGDELITTGAQIATKLIVGADVISAPENALPAWAKTGQESSRIIV